jgi:endonuclease G
VTVNFTEPVDISGAWYNISCGTPAILHNDATVAHTSDFKTYVITPNVSFQFSEQCTVTIDKNSVHDRDLDDGAPDTDTLKANYSWSFTVVGAGAPAPYPPTVHLDMGNPSNATTNLLTPNNYLMEKPGLALSYNRDRGTPNWVSWHLDTSWSGELERFDTFRPDPRIPADWYRVQATDYFSSGFDRGHHAPNADRDHQDRIPLNQETFLMTNMTPQAPDQNQGPWADMENDLRAIAKAGNELYIVMGGYGSGGTGDNGFAATIANGMVTVPSSTWKVALVLPTGENDATRASCGSRTIAVIMPNSNTHNGSNIRDDNWQDFIVSVDAVETLTGYDFFSELPDAVENCVEAGKNGTNPPGTANQSANTLEDTPVEITLQAVRPNTSPLTFSIVSEPTNGSLGSMGATSCIDNACSATVTYTPGLNYDGADSFTFKASQGTTHSNTSTVSITVSPDEDGDGVVDGADNCPSVANADQADFDNDGIGNACDSDDDNDGQSDADEIECGSDPLDAGSLSTDTDGDHQPNCVDLDDDGDGFADGTDNCPLVANMAQADGDGDGIGNACDPNPNDGPIGDLDGDGVLNNLDNCPLTSNPDQADFDLDGIGDSCDSVTGPPKNKDQCKDDGWRRFTSPEFSNQGQCVAYVNALPQP